MKNLRLLIGLTIMVALVFIMFPSSTPAGDVITIKAASPYPVAHYLTADAFEWYGKEIEKRTNGKVKFKWFHAGAIAKWPTSFDAVVNGLCDFGVAGTVFKVKTMPITWGLNLPFITDSPKHASLVAWEMYNTIPEMKKEYKKVKVLGFYSTASINIHTLDSPPKNLEDMKGLRIGSPAPPVVPVLKVLGASAQPIKPGDLYMALHRKMIDGIAFPDAPTRSMKLTDLLSNHTMLDLMNATFGLFMNLKKWKQLPPDVQEVFESVSESAGALCGETLKNEAAWVNEGLKERGDQFYYLPPEEKAKWKERMKPVYGQYIAALNKKGMNGQEILEKIMAISEKYRQKPYGTDDWWGNAGRKK